MTETKLMALREAINLAMDREMRKDDTIYLMVRT
ncbi:TPP-dependent acetoin dehydrogenase complex, E1 component, beta subunit [Streptococcus equi subsp. zooepidemicus]|nr:TPP-dependent acetoin dehydrogenase complex, E1 component, beta subunit [Streptococcus equi subsp. zooepidemicus]